MTLSDKTKGYIIGAVAAASYGTNPLFALPLYGEGMNPDSVLFFRYLLAIPVMGIMLLVRRGPKEFAISRKELWQLALMGVLMALSSLTLFMSYEYMEAGIASTLLFVYPIMVAVIMACFFKERLNLATGICILLALFGIGLLYKSSDGATLSLLGTGLVMASSLTYAVYIVGVNRSTLKHSPTLKVIFYVLIFGVAVFLLRFATGQHLTCPSGAVGWLNVLGLAIVPTAISFICTTAAIQLIGPTPTAILGALEPVTAVVIGVVLFGEVITTRIFIGILLILLAVSFVVAGESIGRPLTHVRKLFPRIRKHP